MKRKNNINKKQKKGDWKIMRKREKQMNKKNNGITLIALVITIIVLLILAGVTIATLTGENGILTRASEASEQTKKANIEEQVKLAVTASIGEDGRIDISKLNEELQKIEGEKTGIPISSLPADITIDGYEVHIDGNGAVSVGGNAGGGNTETGETIVDGVTIPEGFYHVAGTTVETGLVISDQPNDDLDNTAGGNQFVWVPVSKENFDTEFGRRAGYKSGSQQILTSNYGEADSSGNNTNSGVTETATTKIEAQEMYASVEEHGGFYIGRYEAGDDGNGNVVVKKGADVYNNIPWSANGKMQETNGTTGGAVELSRNFDRENEYTSVTSTLIYGVQWDVVMKWMENIENPNAKGSLTKYIQDSTGMGWYSNNYSSGNATHQTGIDVGNNKSNCVNNIYDLAGNVREWTMESCYTYSRVTRGGVYGSTGADNPASSRYDFVSSDNGAGIGFRLTLYL